MTNEPVAVAGAINAAIVSTIAILLFFHVDPQLVAAISLAASGWVGAIAAIVRSKVTPTSNVALTNDQLFALTPPVAAPANPTP